MPSHALGPERHLAGTIVLDARRGVRARPWGTRPGLAHLVVADHTWEPPRDLLTTWLDDLAGRGFAAVRTGALSPEAARVFLSLGFTVEQSLALLTIDPGRGVRSPWRVADDVDIHSVAIESDLAALARIDQAAFGENWGVDVGGLVDACTATPAHRIGVAAGTSFAVTGRSGRAGFLQRLAVHPDHQGRGLGRALVHDSLRWMRRRGVRTAMVNTHTDNTAALGLYASIGFERLALPLHVLTLDLGHRGAQ